MQINFIIKVHSNYGGAFMKSHKILGFTLAFLVLGLLVTPALEARSHFSFGFGTSFVQQRPVVPVYVEDYYPVEQVIVVPAYREQRVMVGARPIPRRVVYSAYPAVQPRTTFSFGFFR